MKPEEFSENWEYLIDTDTQINVQRRLNQYKHQFYIEILFMCINADKISLLIKRAKK